MVIDVVNIQCVAVNKAEDYAPVGANGHSPKTFPSAFERMKPEPRHIQIRDRVSGFQPGEDVAQLHRMLGCYAARIVVLVKALQTLVAE